MNLASTEKEINEKNKMIVNLLHVWCEGRGRLHVASALNLTSTQTLEKWLSKQKVPNFRHDFIIECMNADMAKNKKPKRRARPAATQRRYV